MALTDKKKTTLWNGVLVKTSPTFYGTRMFITLFRTASHWNMFFAEENIWAKEERNNRRLVKIA
jgi:hypothetical protein